MVIRKKIPENFATKDDFQQLRGDFQQIRGDFQQLRGDFQQIKTNLTDKIERVHSELKNDMIDFKDEIIKKLDDLRTDKLMLVAQNRRHEDSILNHEERIVRLEQKVLA